MMRRRRDYESYNRSRSFKSAFQKSTSNSGRDGVANADSYDCSSEQIPETNWDNTYLFLLFLSGGCLISYFSPALYHFVQFMMQNVTIYNIPHSLPNMGDKSLRYQFIRLYYDTLLQQKDSIALNKVKDLNWRHYKPIEIPKDSPASYDIYRCPPKPPQNYPFTWSVADVLSNWPLEDLSIPLKGKIHQSICVFDYQTELFKAKYYQSQELPFITRNDPNVARTVERWNHEGYISNLLSNVPHRTEVSNESHYMYWVHPELARKRLKNKVGQNGYTPPKNWKPPTKMMKMTYKEWIQMVNSTNDENQEKKRSHDYYYFQIAGCGGGRCEEGATEFLYDELVFFQPTKSNLYVVQPKNQKGIHCRFGMPGLSIAAHFDGSRNSIVVLGGSRRYILAHPKECHKLGLYPIDHPSARHSRLSWNNKTLNDNELLRTSRVSEVILQPGDVLYLPTHWFHLIVSLDLNVQCNTRSGIDQRHSATIRRCGF